MTKIELQDSIHQSINQLSVSQQLKVLDFAKSMLVPAEKTRKRDGLLRFSGTLEEEDFEAVEDCG